MSYSERLIAEHGLAFVEVHGVPTTTRVFAAYVGPLPLGALTVDAERATVELVFVQDDCRRLGIASKLLAAARAATGLALDADTGERSAAGAAFARAVGIAAGDRERDLSTAEAEAMGNGLMMHLYGAACTPLVAQASETPAQRVR